MTGDSVYTNVMIEMTFETVRRLFTYEPDTSGDLLWNHRPELPNQWNDTWAGKVVGYKLKTAGETRGYKVVRTHDRDFFAHRLAWLWYCGEWPRDVIDHIDEDRGNNRIANLRDIPDSLNVRRKGQNPANEGIREYVRKDGTSRWTVYTQVDAKWVATGYDDYDVALAAREAHLARHKAALEADLLRYGRLPVPHGTIIAVHRSANSSAARVAAS